MAYSALTIQDLRKALEGLPDDMPVVLCQGCDGGGSADLEVANGVFKSLAATPEEIDDCLDQGLGYLSQDALMLTSGYLSDGSKDPVNR